MFAINSYKLYQGDRTFNIRIACVFLDRLIQSFASTFPPMTTSGLAAPRIRYSITAVQEGVLLSLWEDMPISDTRTKPFSFKARHLVTSDQEAQDILNNYLAAYRQSSLLKS